jgi:cytochrome c oxidase assembly protein subunit 15
MFAYTVLAAALLHAVTTSIGAPGTTHARRAWLLVALVLVQAGLGVATLLLMVPLDVALTHQIVAMAVLIFATAHWRATKGADPLPHEIEVRS